MHRSFRVFLLTVFLLVGADQWLKAFSRNAAEWTEGRVFMPLWPGVFELKLVYNEGVAFGLAQGAGVFLTPIAFGMIGYTAWHSWKKPEETRLIRVLLALLCAGALGNLIDRLWMGKVTDMFWFRLINFHVFNIADVCITFAAILILWLALQDAFKPKTAVTEPAMSPEESETPKPSAE